MKKKLAGMQAVAPWLLIVGAWLCTSCGGSSPGQGGLDAAVDGSASDATADGAGADGDGDADGSSDASTDGGDAGWYSHDCHVTACQGHVYLCGDCLDNDNDGKIDARDPDCLGPCQNNESGFNTDIPGGNNTSCTQECYFDQDTGAGNDDCHWDHRCDTLQPVEQKACDYQKKCSNCDCVGWLASQSQQCLDVCGPLVPNGCDCFGCCELEPGSGEFRFIGSPDCRLDNLAACSLCTPVPACQNDCKHCEICLGKPTLPADCTNGQECPQGQQPCGQPKDLPCPLSTYCVTGCCTPVLQ